MMRVGSLFSGIGGLDLGLERAGMQIAWQVEIDPWCRRVLAKHWPDVRRYADVRECGAADLERVDLICGGFPCQPHSYAGKREAGADERDLWPEFARIIGELKPHWVLAENVPGLLSSESGRFFGRVLRDLAGCGYDAEWQSIPAAAFGAPHIRERVFVVAYAQGQRWSDGVTTDVRQTDREGNAPGNGSAILANSAGERRGETREHSWRSAQRSASGGAVLADADSAGQQDAQGMRTAAEAYGRPKLGASDWWDAEPNVGRMAHGIPSRVDRLRGLGNAVVPQVAEFVGRCIMAAEEGAVS